MKRNIIVKGLGIVCMVMAGAMFLSGCTTTKSQPVQGASREKYMFSVYSAVLPYDMRMVDKAVRETCAKARLIEMGRTNNMNSCEYLYKDINNIRLRINLREFKDETVEIKIKVGATGDKESSQMLLLEIDNNLRAQGGNM